MVIRSILMNNFRRKHPNHMTYSLKLRIRHGIDVELFLWWSLSKKGRFFLQSSSLETYVFFSHNVMIKIDRFPKIDFFEMHIVSSMGLNLVYGFISLGN